MCMYGDDRVLRWCDAAFVGIAASLAPQSWSSWFTISFGLYNIRRSSAQYTSIVEETSPTSCLIFIIYILAERLVGGLSADPDTSIISLH